MKPVSKRAAKRELTPAERALKAALDEVRANCKTAARRAQDPVGFVHRYSDPRDQELVGLLAASLAFGNVTAIRAKLEEALDRVGPSPYMAADDAQALRRALKGWVHRVYRGEDIAGLLAGARAVQRASGSLGARFAADLEREGDYRAALAAFCDAIREAGGFPLRKLGKGDRRGPSHLLPDPRGGSGSKRLLLYLRWMIRPADGIDLGLWPVSPAVLLCPVDTHIHKLALNLGLCRRKNPSWETTAEITEGLRRFDPEDPVKYDFSLCHMGMLQRCPSRRDAMACDGCAVKPVCRHWQTKAALGKRALSLVP